MRRKPLLIGLAVAGAVTLGLAWGQPWRNEEIPPAPFWELPPPVLPAVDLTSLAPEAIDLSSSRVFPSLTYGIHVSFWWDRTYRLLGLDHMHLLQFTHVRQKFAWRDIEPELRDEDDPQRYVWAQADAMMDDIEAKGGVEVIARLDAPPDWAVLQGDNYNYYEPPFNMGRLTDYCGMVAARYRGRIAGYQVWNEPNLSREWGGHFPNPAAYVEVLAACATAIRAADPDAIIISAGLAPTGTRFQEVMPHDEFLWAMYAAGAGDYFDVLGVHAPGYRSAPEVDPNDPENEDLPWMYFRHVEYMRAVMVANGDAHKQIAIMEMGWTIDPRPDSPYHWHAVTPEQQGDYLRRAYLYAAEHWRPWVGLIVTIYYPATEWTEADEQYWWAIGTPAPMPFGMDGRPAWWALLRMEKISTNPAYSHPARPDTTGGP